MPNPYPFRDQTRAKQWYEAQTSRSRINLHQALDNLGIAYTINYEVLDPEWRGYKGTLKEPGQLIFNIAIHISGRLALIHYTGKKTDGQGYYNRHSQAVTQAKIDYAKRHGIPLLKLNRRTPVKILEWQIKRFIRQVQQEETSAQ